MRACKQITMDDPCVYEQLNTYIIQFVSEYGFKTDWCKAETEENAMLMIRDKYRNHKDFQFRRVDISNRSIEEIESMD